MTKHLPKADMHVHLEATMTPEMTRKIAVRNNITLHDNLLNEAGDCFHWDQGGMSAAERLQSFITTYDEVSSALKTAQDFSDITYDYLLRSAKENAIYAEVIISPDHGLQAGLTYPEMLDGIVEGYERAKAETGIEARFMATFVRHYGPKNTQEIAKLIRDYPHPLVTGLHLSGDENAFTFKDFLPSYEIAGLKNRIAHAGEAAGSESVRAARDVLKIRRFGHMVRAVEDAELMRELVRIKAVAEVCVSSNLALNMYPSAKEHPLRELFDAGIKVVLGSDDPTFFGTSIGKEYKIAQDECGFTDTELLQITQNAIEEAFVDEATRKQLFDKFHAAQKTRHNGHTSPGF